MTARFVVGYLCCVLHTLDQTGLLDRPKKKWYKRPTQKIGICFHHTGVSGGFGGAAKVTMEERYAPHGSDFLAESLGILGVAARYRGLGYGDGVPYHYVISNCGKYLIRNLPIGFRTKHGNGANTDHVGVAWDGDSRKDTIPTGGIILAGMQIVGEARLAGHDIREITCHSVYTNKPHDPGAEIIDYALRPIATATGCTIHWDYRRVKRAKTMREIVEG